MRTSILFFLVACLFLSFNHPTFDPLLPPVYLSQGETVINSHSASGDSCVLEDGSVWQVCPSDSSILFTWNTADYLSIYPHRGWFSSYQYEIKNHSTNSSILVNLVGLSTTKEEHVNRLAGLDLYQGILILQDGTEWLLNFSDESVYSKWNLGDAIIIGKNKVGFFASDQHILINLYQKSYARASEE